MDERKPFTAADPSGSILSPRLLQMLAWTAGGYFLVRLIYFVIAIDHTIPPDEVTHLDRVKYFSKFLFLPTGAPEEGTAHLWVARYHPPLYYLLAGKLLWLNVFPVGDMVFTRLLSVGLNCVTVLFGWRFIREISPKPLVHFLFLVMMTNTLMFSFLSASINYDALTNLLAATGFYYMARYFRGRSAQAFLLLLLSLLLGTLTKVTMLPFSFAVAVAFLIHERGRIGPLLTAIRTYWTERRMAPKLLVILALCLFGVNALFYGRNVLQFGHLVPRSEQVLSDTDMRSDSISSRSKIYVGFLRGEFDIEEARGMARQIRSPAASLDTMNLLNYGAWRAEHQGPFVPMSRLAYAIPWSKLMLYSTYGVMANSVTYKTFAAYVPYILLFATAIIFFLVRGLKRQVERWEYLSVGMLIFYVLILMQVVNYSSYLTFQLSHLGVQGRYLFLFLLPVYGMTAKYLLTFGSARTQSVIVIVTALYFVYGDFPFFLATWGNGPW